MQVNKAGREILKVLCGSRAYGLNDENSDYDYHSIFLVPTFKMHELGVNLKAVHWQESETEDNTGWELGHFLHLATHGNPTVLETFVAPVENTTVLGEELRALFPAVLAKRHVYNAFRGYAHNQMKKMLEPSEGQERRMNKAAIAYLRSLLHGETLLRTGTYNPRFKVGDEGRNVLLGLRTAGEAFNRGRVINQADLLEARLKNAFEASTMQEEPDLDTINKFLLRVRYENFWEANPSIWRLSA